MSCLFYKVMKMNSFLKMDKCFVLFLVIALAGCTSDHSLKEDYTSEVMEWRKERKAELYSEEGFLNLSGLYWLEDGELRGRS